MGRALVWTGLVAPVVSVALAASGSALAAPLDALLSATPERGVVHARLELGADLMNQQLDVLNFYSASSDPDQAAGDYRGAHVSGGVRVGEQGWLSGSLWQRAVSDASDTYNYTSWQLSGQYRFMQQLGRLPAMAVRLSGWGNYASATQTTKAVVVPGAKLDTVKSQRASRPAVAGRLGG
jgi:hypothetical protein